MHLRKRATTLKSKIDMVRNNLFRAVKRFAPARSDDPISFFDSASVGAMSGNLLLLEENPARNARPSVPMIGFARRTISGSDLGCSAL